MLAGVRNIIESSGMDKWTEALGVFVFIVSVQVMNNSERLGTKAASEQETLIMTCSEMCGKVLITWKHFVTFKASMYGCCLRFLKTELGIRLSFSMLTRFVLAE